jgi:hypothetical protein
VKGLVAAVWPNPRSSQVMHRNSGASAVTCGAGQSPLLRPTVITVHDDADVRRQPRYRVCIDQPTNRGCDFQFSVFRQSKK